MLEKHDTVWYSFVGSLASFLWCHNVFLHDICRGSYQLSLLLRILKRLKAKDPREIEWEKLEQGFSIYLNGANAEAFRNKSKSSNHKSVTSSPASRSARTAGMLLLDQHKLKHTMYELVEIFFTLNPEIHPHNPDLVASFVPIVCNTNWQPPLLS